MGHICHITHLKLQNPSPQDSVKLKYVRGFQKEYNGHIEENSICDD